MRARLQDTPDVGIIPPFVRQHRRSVSGGSWTPRLAEVHQEREQALDTAPRGHRRAWSGSSWSRLSQFNGPMGTQLHGSVNQLAAPDADRQSQISDQSDVPLLDAATTGLHRGHHRQTSTGSDTSLLGEQLSSCLMS